jgi:TolB-like protein/Flp pilus assembly protein TadD
LVRFILALSESQTGHPASPTRVFLSYASDDRSAAEVIVAALESAGFNVWWDGLISGGAVYSRSIDEALKGAAAVVVLWSAHSIASHWVRDEATFGRDHSRLVPVSLDGTEPPLGFRQFQVIDLSKWRGKADAAELTAIVHAIAIARQSPPAMPPAGAAPAPRSASRRRFLIAGGSTALAALAGTGWLAWRDGLFSSGAAAANSIVVLPFENLSGDPDRNYFSEGLAAEVRAALARNSALRVISGVSSEAFRNANDDAVSIARKLGVAFLLDGNVRLAGTTFRIAAELIDGATGFSRWTQSFDRSIDNIFAVQSEIAAAAVSALTKAMIRAGNLSGANEHFTTVVGGTDNAAAYDAYLRGRALFNLAESESTDRAALAHFDAAIAADPAFAAAHAARSRTLTVIANHYAEAQDTRPLYDQAIAAAETSTSIAADLADGHSALGLALFQGRLDVKAARAPYDLSYQLGQGDAPVVARYALYCAMTGRVSDAMPAMAHALDLDPLNPLVHRAMGVVLYNARRYADAIVRVAQALAMNPKMGDAHAIIGSALFLLGRDEEARDEYLAESSSLVGLPGIAIIEQKLGNIAAARTALAQLVAEHGASSLYQQAQVAAQWGERDGAMALLLQARTLGDSGLVYARNDPMLDPLRQMPEFIELLQHLGFD